MLKRYVHKGSAYYQYVKTILLFSSFYYPKKYIKIAAMSTPMDYKISPITCIIAALRL